MGKQAETPATGSASEKTLLNVDEATAREIKIQQAMGESQYTEWKAWQAAVAAGGGGQIAGGPTVLVSKPMPANYVVYLGPEPPAAAELRMSALGRVETIPDRQVFHDVDGGGDGKRKAVRNTVNAGHTGRYLEDGYSDIYFEHRCPPNHKYAGRPWAEILCPEHAAWLYLTRGKNREGERMLVFMLTTDYRAQYELLRDSNMRKLHQTDRDVEEIMTKGEPLPAAA